MADLWTDLRRQSVAEQTRPRTVWSNYGGRRRQVTVVWPRGERGMWRYEARRGLVVLAGIGALALLSVVAVELLVDQWLSGGVPDDRDGDPTYGLLLFTAFVALSLTATAVGLVVGGVRDLRGRRRPEVTEGAVVLRQDVVEQGEDVVHRYYLAVDDGTSDTVPAVQVHQGLYAHFTIGDVVRLVRARGTGRVLQIEGVHDAEGRPLPPLGTMPAAPPEAGITTGEVAQAIGQTVRALEVATSDDAGTPVQTWTFHLVPVTTHVRIHLSSGGQHAADAIVALANPEDRTPRPVPGLGDTAQRYRAPSLLVARRGTLVVGIQKSPFTTPPRTWWDEELARKALSRLSQ
jgi:hypothetical protein